MALLTVDKVSMFFGGLAALSNISFSVEQGEILALIGPNGAGKTTLFNVVNGFYKPSRGEVRFKDRTVSGLKPHQICRLGVARTFQVVKPLQRMSVLDNVIASAFLRSRTKAGAERRALEILEFTGLMEDRAMISKGLPLGKRKRLEIARALATEPYLLLLDEPAAGMNPQETMQLKDLVLNIRERYKLSILLIEHDMKMVMSLSDRVFVMEYGQMISVGTPAEVSRDPQVIRAYLGEDHDG